MRIVTLVGLALCLTACTMDNPAFSDSESGSTNDAGDGDGDGAGDGDGDGDGTGDGDGDGDGVGDGDGDGDGGGDGDGDGDGDGATCDFDQTDPLDIVFGPVPGDPECNSMVQGFFKVVATEGKSLLLNPCGAQPGCDQCDPEFEVPLSMHPLDPTASVSIDACLWINVDDAIDNGNPCQYADLTVWSEGEIPIIIGTRGTVAAPAVAEPPLGGWAPIPFAEDACECADFPDMEDCCEDMPPQAYKLNVGGNVIAPGDSVPVNIGNGDPVPFEFYNVQSYYPGTCPGELQVSWALIR